MNENMIQCACGCCGIISPGKKYIHGHNQKGKKQSLEWVAKKAVGIKAAWANPSQMLGNRNRSTASRERTASKLRGRKYSKEHRAHISASLKGRQLSPEHRQKSLKGLLRITELPPDAEARRRHSLSIAKTGTHGYGRGARDNPKHCKALHWVVRDPAGQVWEFDNASSWARAHQHLFEPDDRPESRLPLWQRFVNGLNNMIRRDKKGAHSWRGWVRVSSTEIGDLLERRVL